MLELAFAGGGDFLAGLALEAALLRLLGVAVLLVFFLESTLASGRFLFLVEVRLFVSVSAAFAFDFAFDFALLAVAFATVGSVVGLRWERRAFVAGSAALALASSTAAAAPPERVRNRVEALTGGVGSVAFGAVGVVLRWRVRTDVGFGVLAGSIVAFGTVSGVSDCGGATTTGFAAAASDGAGVVAEAGVGAGVGPFFVAEPRRPVAGGGGAGGGGTLA